MPGERIWKDCRTQALVSMLCLILVRFLPAESCLPLSHMQYGRHEGQGVSHLNKEQAVSYPLSRCSCKVSLVVSCYRLVSCTAPSETVCHCNCWQQVLVLQMNFSTMSRVQPDAECLQHSLPDEQHEKVRSAPAKAIPPSPAAMPGLLLYRPFDGRKHPGCCESLILNLQWPICATATMRSLPFLHVFPVFSRHHS